MRPIGDLAASLPNLTRPRAASGGEVEAKDPADQATLQAATGAGSITRARHWTTALLKSQTFHLAGWAAMTMAGIAGKLAPESTMMYLLSSQWVTPTIGAAARLGIFDELPATPAALAQKLDLDPDATQRLMRGVAALGAVKQNKDGSYELTRTGELLKTDHPRSFKPLALMLTDPAHYEGWGQLAHSVKTGEPGVKPALGVGNVFDHYAVNPDEAERFNHAMTALSRSVTQDLGVYYDFSRANRIVDVGGGHGFLLAAALKAAPQARGTLFDQGRVVAGATPELEKHGVDDRVDRVAGSFFHSVPGGGDIYLLKNILHDWNDDECVQILTNLRKAMPDHARLLIVETMVEDKPGAADFMNLNMLVMTGGRERTRGEFSQLLAQSGLKLDNTIPTAGPFYLLECSRAS